jgi:hypothetical protein
MTSTASVFAFLLWRTIVGATRRRLARLREPRYLAGGLVGGLYLYFWFIGPLLHGGLRHRGSGPAFQLSPELAMLLQVLAAAALALNASLLWLFHGGTPALHVTEAEVQFLAPAPLPRRALLHFSLIRTELALLFSAFVVAWVMGRAFVPHFWQAVVAAFLVFSTLQLHVVGHTFWQARWSEAQPATRHLMHAATAAAALLGLSVLAWLVAMVRAAVAILLVRPGEAPVTNFADFSLRAQALHGLHPWTVGFVPQVLLAPFRAVLAPALAADSLAFVKALPAALAILAAHYVWVVRANVRYEEAALEGARRAAARLGRRRGGRLRGLPSEARRLNVPFPLPSGGRPELAVFWKNLISRGRVRLSRAAALWVGAMLFVLAASGACAVAYPGVAMPVLLVIGIASAGPALGVTLALPMSYRNDFREDLENAAVLRAWPLSPSRLAAAELAAPLVRSIGAAWALVSFGVVGIAGGRLALAWNGTPWTEGNAGPVPTHWIAPALFALAILMPALAAAILVVQNAAVLAFPAWFPPGGQRPGFEATGTRLISFAATLLLVLFALTPAALVASLAAWLTWRLLGPWSLVPAAAIGSVPVWVGVAAGVALLGRLFARFDVSAESWS